MIEFHYVILFAYLICTDRCILLYAHRKLSLLHYLVRSVNVIMRVRMTFYRSVNLSLHIQGKYKQGWFLFFIGNSVRDKLGSNSHSHKIQFTLIIHVWYTADFFMGRLHTWQIIFPWILHFHFHLKELRKSDCNALQEKEGLGSFLGHIFKNSIPCTPWSLNVSVELLLPITTQPSSLSSVSSIADNSASTWSELVVLPTQSLDLHGL